MALAKPKAGETYRYSGENPLGTDAGALTPGEVVEIREVVPAGETGAHDDSEDAAVIIWQTPSLLRTADGWERGTTERAMSIGLSGFHSAFTKEA